HGRVAFRGDDLLALAAHAIARRGIARTFQNTEVFRRLSALDNVLIGRHARLEGGVLGGALALPRVRSEETRARRDAPALLDLLGLGAAAAVEAASLPPGHHNRLDLRPPAAPHR